MDNFEGVDLKTSFSFKPSDCAEDVKVSEVEIDAEIAKE